MGMPSNPNQQMGHTVRLAALASCAVALLLAGPAVAEEQRARTSDEASQANLQGALLAPVRDLNLVRDQVPEVLNGAKEAPYLDPQKASCAELATMIEPLDKALGPDVGDGAEGEKPGARNMVFGAMADVTRDVIPFRGVVRRITGASKHDQEVKAAREAGQLRRAYLKGFASANGCYGPPEQQVATQSEAAPVTAPKIQVAPAIQTVELTPPPVTKQQPAPATPDTRFKLPESWLTQISASQTY